jgi:glutamine amidotransferase
MSVAIINYGSGNTFSVSNALNKIQIQNKVVSNPSEIPNFSTLILPGVGNFRACINKFKEKKFYNSTMKHIFEGKKIIGICVGMQMLFEYSEEDGKTDGMSILEGKVTLLKNNEDNYKEKLKLPNIGWSTIKVKDRNNIYFKNIKNLEYYFAHSYACELKDKNFQIATNTYGNQKYICMVKKDNIIGIQFHPEKSGESGLKLLKNILDKA